MLSIFHEPIGLGYYNADFPEGLTHVILVSSVNEAKKKAEFMPYKHFKSSLIDRLSRDLPSIAVAGYSFGGDPYSIFADYVGRKLPLVLIDARPPPTQEELDSFRASRPEQAMNQSDTTAPASMLQQIVDAKYDEAKWFLEDVVEKKLTASSTWNFHDASIISYLTTKVIEVWESRIAFSSKSTDSSSGKRQWLFMALKDKLRATESEGNIIVS